MKITDTLKVFCDVSTHIYFFIDTKDSKVIYANASFENLFNGFDTEKLMAIISKVHAEDREFVTQNFEACKAGEKIDGFECRIIINGALHYYKLYPIRITGNKHDVIGCCAEDVTALRDYINILNEHNKKKNSILNIISHDLIGPIGIIQSLSSYLSDHNNVPNQERLQQYFHLIHKTSNKCINMIRNFINQEFLESAEVKLVKSRTELVSKINLLLEDYKGSELHLKKQFSLHASKEKIYAEIDEDKFFQVLNNLISNSLKFTRDNGNIGIYIEERNQTILISVADDGIGIPRKYHDQLFEKFNSAGRSGLRGEQSVGLGMSIIKTIVDWHKGKIYFESEENKGTTFHIEIPK